MIEGIFWAEGRKAIAVDVSCVRGSIRTDQSYERFEQSLDLREFCIKRSLACLGRLPLHQSTVDQGKADAGSSLTDVSALSVTLDPVA